MARNHNTDFNGNVWTDDAKRIIWGKGIPIAEFDPNEWRYDHCGNVMNWKNHGDRDSIHGWEIDHINPVANNGGDSIENLQPLYWANNLDKGDSTNWTCPSPRFKQ